jgi:hypothetical protein
LKLAGHFKFAKLRLDMANFVKLNQCAKVSQNKRFSFTNAKKVDSFLFSLNMQKENNYKFSSMAICWQINKRKLKELTNFARRIEL